MSALELEQTSLFQLVDASLLERLRPHARLRAFEEKEYLYHESQDAAVLWTLRSGEVRTLKGSSSGRVTTLEVLRPGDPFGLAAMNETGAYTETAQGVLAGEAWVVPRSVIGSMVAQHPELARALLSLVAIRLRLAHERLCSFAHDSVTERMARAVLGSTTGGQVRSTRRLLGERAGTTVETAIRILRRFERAGWIEGGVGWIRVLDREALSRVARGEDTPRS